MSMRTFIDAVAKAVPRAADGLKKLLEDDLEDYAVSVAAGELGEYAIALYERSESGTSDELTKILVLTERAAAATTPEVVDALHSDYFPAIESTGPIPRKLYALMGPKTRELIDMGDYELEGAVHEHS